MVELQPLFCCYYSDYLTLYANFRFVILLELGNASIEKGAERERELLVEGKMSDSRSFCSGNALFPLPNYMKGSLFPSSHSRQ